MTNRRDFTMTTLEDLIERDVPNSFELRGGLRCVFSEISGPDGVAMQVDVFDGERPVSTRRFKGVGWCVPFGGGYCVAYDEESAFRFREASSALRLFDSTGEEVGSFKSLTGKRAPNGFSAVGVGADALIVVSREARWIICPDGAPFADKVPRRFNVVGITRVDGIDFAVVLNCDTSRYEVCAGPVPKKWALVDSISSTAPLLWNSWVAGQIVGRGGNKRLLLSCGVNVTDLG